MLSNSAPCLSLFLKQQLPVGAPGMCVEALSPAAASNGTRDKCLLRPSWCSDLRPPSL